jgi:hypothetical protein
VKYSATWLTSSHADHGELPSLRGTVQQIIDPHSVQARAVVSWNGLDEPVRVPLSNLVKVSPREIRDEIGNALIAAQNALTGYFQLSNGPDAEEHHQCAQHALEAVRIAIRAERVLEQQGIVR